MNPVRAASCPWRLQQGPSLAAAWGSIVRLPDDSSSFLWLPKCLRRRTFRETARSEKKVVADSPDHPYRGVPATSLSLIRRLRDCEQTAWSDFLHLYYPLIYSWCRRAGLQEQDAVDVVQEVFRAVLGGVAGFRRDRSGASFHAWLRGITRHKLQDFWRGRELQRQPVGGTTAWQQIERVPEQVNLEDSQQEDLNTVTRRALELVRMEFEVATWDAACMVLVAGQSPAEVAQRLGVSTNAVYKAKARVMRRVREKLSDLFD